MPLAKILKKHKGGFCEHCGKVNRMTYEGPYGGTWWCKMCMDANGYSTKDHVSEGKCS